MPRAGIVRVASRGVPSLVTGPAGVGLGVGDGVVAGVAVAVGGGVGLVGDGADGPPADEPPTGGGVPDEHPTTVASRIMTPATFGPMPPRYVARLLHLTATDAP